MLHARRATQLLAAEAERLGAGVVASPDRPGDEPSADVVVWACGAWLPTLFPDEVDVRVERRDVFFFGGDASWRDTPGWVEYDNGFYGHGDIGGLGVKVAPGPPERRGRSRHARPLPARASARTAAREYIAGGSRRSRARR